MKSNCQCHQTFEVSRQGTVQALLHPGLIGSWWKVGQQQAETPAGQRHIQTGGEQIVSVHSELNTRLMFREHSLDGTQAL